MAKFEITVSSAIMFTVEADNKSDAHDSAMDMIGCRYADRLIDSADIDDIVGDCPHCNKDISERSCNYTIVGGECLGYGCGDDEDCCCKCVKEG